MTKLTDPSPLALTPDASARRTGLGLLLIADALLSFAPVAILGAAIGWPASLDRPAADQLAAIAAQPGSVALGYAVYLFYSILVAPVMIGLASRTFGGLNSTIAATVAAFGALSALARSIGILRWLTVMPILATAHSGAGADPALRMQIEWLFKGLTEYGGGIGEVLGVSVLMAVSVATLSVAALVRGGMPRWLASLGLLSALLLAALALPVLRGPDIVPVAVAVSLLSLWMIAAGVWVMKKPVAHGLSGST
jgi:hypothetical protein